MALSYVAPWNQVALSYPVMLSYPVVLSYPAALVLTLGIEVPVVALALRLAAVATAGRAIILIIAANLLSHPPVWLAIAAHPGSWPVFAAAEVAAWLGEAALLFIIVRRDLVVIVLATLVANSASCLAGVLLLIP